MKNSFSSVQQTKCPRCGDTNLQDWFDNRWLCPCGINFPKHMTDPRLEQKLSDWTDIILRIKRINGMKPNSGETLEDFVRRFLQELMISEWKRR